MFETWIETEMTKLPTVMRLMGRAFQADDGGNKVGVIVTRNGEPEEFRMGGIYGSVMLPDGTMINNIQGNWNENRAWIVLPAEAYAQQGMITVTIKEIVRGASTTYGVLEAYVYPSTL